MKTLVRRPEGTPPLAESDAAERVILVDRHDREVGVMGKLECHRVGRLHRAFSVLVHNRRGEMLLQRRADEKYHFAGRWSNACCGHPRPGEPTPAAAVRRLREELGFSIPLVHVGALLYRAADGDSGLIEHEYLHVFFGTYTGRPAPDPCEIGAWRWMSAPRIRRALARFPEQFTPWFALLMEKVERGQAESFGLASRGA